MAASPDMAVDLAGCCHDLAYRVGVPRDVADTCLYLSSPLASYVTGANILVHGGGEKPAFLDAANGVSQDAPSDAAGATPESRRKP